MGSLADRIGTSQQHEPTAAEKMWASLPEYQRQIERIVSSRGMTHEVKRAKLESLCNARYLEGWRAAMSQENPPESKDAAQRVEP